MLENHQNLLAEYSAIQQAMSELTAIYNDAPIGMAVIGTDFRFQRINARLAQINGAPVEAHLGRTMREVVPKLADLAEGLVRKIAETGESILNIEIEGETAAEPGVTRSFIEHWSPVKGRGRRGRGGQCRGRGDHRPEAGRAGAARQRGAPARGAGFHQRRIRGDGP